MLDIVQSMRPTSLHFREVGSAAGRRGGVQTRLMYWGVGEAEGGGGWPDQFGFTQATPIPLEPLLPLILNLVTLQLSEWAERALIR